MSIRMYVNTTLHIYLFISAFFASFEAEYFMVLNKVYFAAETNGNKSK